MKYLFGDSKDLWYTGKPLCHLSVGLTVFLNQPKHIKCTLVEDKFE